MHFRTPIQSIFLLFFLILLVGIAERANAARPNVLFIICDDLNTQSIGCYGSTIVKTPNMDRLANRGVRFERAYCQWPLCLPSRNSFLSGQRPDERFNQGPLRKRVPDVTFMPEYFRKHGYFTARVGKLMHCRTVFNGAGDLEDPACWDVSEKGGIPSDPCGYGVVYASHPKGLPAHPELKPLVLEHKLLNGAGSPAYDYWMDMAVLKDGTDTVDANIARRISALIDERAKPTDGKPFFIAAGFRRPHLLWVAPESCFKMYDPKTIELPKEPANDLEDIPKPAFTRGAPNMTDKQRRQAIAAYYALVTHVDNQLGVILDTLERNQLTDNTIIVFTSDHGWHLNNHGLWGKVSLFQESAKIPLIIAAPNVARSGAASPRTVEMLDFYPTLAELAGLPAPTRVDGVSIVPQLKDPQAPRDRPAYSVLLRDKIWGRAVYTEDFRYTEWGQDAADGLELYDLSADPREFTNLASDPAHAATRTRLKKLLQAALPKKAGG